MALNILMVIKKFDVVMEPFEKSLPWQRIPDLFSVVPLGFFLTFPQNPF